MGKALRFFGLRLEHVFRCDSMSIISTLSFLVDVSGEHEQATHTVVPKIDGTLLTELIASYEDEQRFEPVGGYGGLIVEYFNYGPLDLYFMGQFEQYKKGNYWADLNGIYVLGCGDCGDVGCWPLFCRVRLDGDSVVWENFEQPHRLKRDYSNFGPFTFDFQQYHDTITDLQTQCKIQMR
jgi:hypothetical protein